MLTIEQALTANEFHAGECSRLVGPRGGVTITQEVWRRNGRTQTWKRNPERFRIPVKHGLRVYGNIWHSYSDVHAAEDCPLRS